MIVLKIYVDENLHQVEILLRQWQRANEDRRLVISKRVHKLVNQISLMEQFVVLGGGMLFPKSAFYKSDGVDEEVDSLSKDLEKTCKALVNDHEANKSQLCIFFYQLFFKMLSESKLV